MALGAVSSDNVTMIVAFGGGIISILSPCVLPMVPGYIALVTGLEVRDVQRIRQHLLDQLCAASGGPCFYPGKDMKAAHAEMEITDAAWNAFTGHIAASLDKFRVGDRERNEFVAVVNGLKGDIVCKP